MEWTEILLIALFPAFVAAGIALLWAYLRNNRKIKTISDKYKALYDEVSYLLSNDNYFVILFDSAGRLVYGEESMKEHGITTQDIVEYCDDDEIRRIMEGETLSLDATFNGHSYYVVCKKYEDGGKCGFVSVYSSLQNVVEESDKLEDLENFVNYATGLSFIGLAIIQIPDSIGYANDLWFDYLGEKRNDRNYIKPVLGNMDDEDRKALIDDYEKRMKGFAAPFSRDVVVSGGPEGRRCLRFHSLTMKVGNAGEVELIVQIILDNDKAVKQETEIMRAWKNAARAENEKNNFLMEVSREVRGPLNSVVGFSTLLSEDGGRFSQEERGEMMKTVKENTGRLFKLIGDVLDLSKFDAGSYNFNYAPTDLDGCFADYLYMIKSGVRSPEVDASKGPCRGNPVFVTDVAILGKIYSNLISNACRYTERGSIQIRYTAYDTYYSFFIMDTGCGIADDDMARLFKRFDRIDEYSPGFGLGLPLAKAMVEGMGGKIGVLSEKGQSTSVWFTLPIRNDENKDYSSGASVV